MKCFSEGCAETPELVCCCNGEALICKTHFDDHITLAGFTHNVKALQITPDPDLKKHYIEFLKVKLQSLEKSSSWLIKDICNQIEKLESYLEGSLERIDKEKKAVNDLISEIISIEKIPKSAVNDIRAIFTLSKTAGKKRIKEHIEQKSGQNSFEIEWIKSFEDQSKILQKIKVGKLNKMQGKMAVPEPISSRISMCALPNKKTFYYGNYVKETMAYSGIAFTIDERNNEKVQMLTAGIPCISSGLIYCDETVYSFGGKLNENLNICQKYDLKENAWIALAALERPSSCCSCEIFGKLVVYSGIGIGVNTYNISLNLHSQVLSLPFNTSKIVLNSGKRIVVVENGGKIYESAVFNINSWSCIGNSPTPNLEPIGHKVFNDNFVYFILLGSEKQIYQFRKETLAISIINANKVEIKKNEESKEIRDENAKVQDKEELNREVKKEENKVEIAEQIKIEIKEETKELPKVENKNIIVEIKQKTKNQKEKKEVPNAIPKKQKKENQAKNKSNQQEKAQKTYKKKEAQEQGKLSVQKPQEELKDSEKGNPTQPKYKRKEIQEDFRENNSQKEDPKKENEIYISSKGSKKYYVEEALTLLNREDIREVILKGSNMATFNVVCTAEVIKRLKDGLFQINELLHSTREIENDDAKEKERTSVFIHLSKDPLDPNHYGYQPPIYRDTNLLPSNPEPLPSFYTQSDVRKFQNWRDYAEDI